MTPEQQKREIVRALLGGAPLPWQWQPDRGEDAGSDERALGVLRQMADGSGLVRLPNGEIVQGYPDGSAGQVDGADQASFPPQPKPQQFDERATGQLRRMADGSTLNRLADGRMIQGYPDGSAGLTDGAFGGSFPPQPAPSPLRRRNMMERANTAAEEQSSAWMDNDLDMHPAAVIQMAERLSPDQQAMLEGMHPHDRFMVLSSVARGATPEQAFALIGQ